MLLQSPQSNSYCEHCLLQVFREIKVEGFDASQYTTKQVFYPSKDGTDIPMFVVHKKVSYRPVNMYARIILYVVCI